MDVQWQLYPTTSTTGDEQPPNSGLCKQHAGHLLPYHLLQSRQLCGQGQAWMGLGGLDQSRQVCGQQGRQQKGQQDKCD